MAACARRVVDSLGLLYLSASIVLAVTAQVVLKLGMAASERCAEVSWQACLPVMVTSVTIFAGVGLHALDLVFWILALSRMDLSFAYPVSSVQYVLVFAGSWYVLGERISVQRLSGVLLICTGVLVMWCWERSEAR